MQRLARSGLVLSMVLASSGCLELYIAFSERGGSSATSTGGPSTTSSLGVTPFSSSTSTATTSSTPLSSGGVRSSSNASGSTTSGSGVVGSSGSGGSGSSAAATLCQEKCTMTADCVAGFTCSAAGRCVKPCTDLKECVPAASRWNTQCDDDGACNANEICASVGESRGRCAFVPSTAVTCASVGLTDFQVQHYGVSEVVVVCANTEVACENTLCVPTCSADTDCRNTELPKCDMGTRRCACTAASCTINASVCDNGACKCAGDGDCAFNADVCINGSCGCSAVGACTGVKQHPATLFVCE